MDESNGLRRTKLDRSIFRWSYVFGVPSPRIRFLAIGVEIGVVLLGERLLSHADGTTRVHGPGCVSVVDLGEIYTTSYTPPAIGNGKEVGFVVRLDREDAYADRGVVPTFPRSVARYDARIVELAAELARGSELPAEAVSREVRAFVDRHAVLAPVDALVVARLELHRHFAKPLYMRHFAEMAGVHPATFARKFAARFGVTPTRYRTMLRLQEAAVLLATRKELTVGQVALRVGFEDVPYFHRAFAARLGATPLGLARRFSETRPS